MNQPTFFDIPPTFDGTTFDYAQDFDRLATALDRVAHLMRDGRPRTLGDIASACGCSEAGASARLRDLRKPKFQRIYKVADVISKRHDGGLWKYQVIRPGRADS